MWNKILLIVLLLFLFVKGAEAATDFYVHDTGGNNTNNGSTTVTAWRTWAKIRTAAPPYYPNDTINLTAGGSWSEASSDMLTIGSGTASNPIVFKKYGTQTVNPVVNTTAGNNYSFDLRNSNYVTIQDIDFTGGDLYPFFLYPQTGTMTTIKVFRSTITSISTAAPSHFVRIGESGTTQITDVEIGSCTVKGTSTGFVGNVDAINAFQIASGLWIHDCIFHGAGDIGSGVDIAGGNDHLYEKNIVYEMGNLVKFHGQQYPMLRPICRYSLYYDSPSSANNNGIIISDVQDGSFHNLTLFMGTVSISAGIVTNISTNLSKTLNTKIQNNIFYGSRNGEAAFEIDNLTNAEFNGSTTTNHNCYWATNGNAIKIVDTGVTISNSGSSTWTSQHTGDIFSDPLFINPSADNYRLQWNSPCIDSGISMGTHTTDLDGNPVYGTPDMGCYEYQPPFAIGTNTVDITGTVTLYADGLYRYKTGTTTGILAPLDIYATSGRLSGTYSNWMDIDIQTWTGTSMTWVETPQWATNTTHKVSSLTSGRTFESWYTSSGGSRTFIATSTAVNGSITFNYTGGMATTTLFEVVDVGVSGLAISSGGAPMTYSGDLMARSTVPDVLDDLVFRAPMNQETGATVLDVSGYGANGTITGAIWVNVGGRRCLSLDGIDDYATIPYNSATNIEGSKSVSLSLWFNPLNQGEDVDKLIEKIRDNGVDDRGGFRLDNYQAKPRFLLFSNLETGNIQSSITIGTGAWNHICGTYDNTTGSFLLYINGIQRAAGTQASGIGTHTTVNITLSNFSSSACPQGYIDDPRIYDRALSATEVMQAYNATNGNL